MDLEDREALERFDRGLRFLRASLNPLISSQSLQAFLAVGMNEGRTQTEYAEMLGTNVSTASRQLLDLSERNRKREPGYKVVEVVTDPMDSRVGRYRLAPKGKLLMRELAEQLKDK